MLQYFVGKNVQELTCNEFEVILNSNNGSLDLESIIVKCYDENGNRGVYPELPTPSRPGYRFDGWYLSFDVSDLEAERIEAGDPVYYNPTYLKQTLYAHWTEIYTVKYDINAPTNASSISGNMEDSLFECDEKEALTKNKFNIVGWTFKGWATYANGSVVYSDGDDVVGLAHAGEAVTLYAVWEANTYTIKFKGNKPENASGTVSGNMDSIKCAYDTTVTLDTSDYKLTGWIFKGWALSSEGDVIYEDGAKIKNLTVIDDDVITLYAVWEPYSYTVIYDNNCGTGTMEPSIHMYDTAKELENNTFTNSGYQFTGWNTRPDGGGTGYANKAEVENLVRPGTDSITLYAQWLANAYIVYYDANTGEGSTQFSTHTYDVQSRLNANGFSKTGYSFVGWNTKEDGSGANYENTATIINLVSQENGSITLYAQWKANMYTIHYDANGGTGTTSSSTHTYDTSKALTSNGFTRQGWTFTGWNTKADGTGTTYANTASVKNLSEANGATITLYAQWKANTYTVCYDANGGIGTTSSSTHTYDTSKALTANGFTRQGWMFTSWNTKADGSGITYANTAYVKNLSDADGAVIILYAQWTAVYSRNGQKLNFGSYPQTEVTDSSLNSTLNSKVGTLPTISNSQSWTSYGYYISGSVSNFMWYIDIEYVGEKYRGVYFTSYRPEESTRPSSSSQQDDNGYRTNTIYWFKYEPISWTILNENTANGTALILCDMIIDAQAYQDEYEYDSSTGKYYNTLSGVPNGTYANNYAYSTIRKWLNETFYNTAFSEFQKQIILTTTLDNSATTTSSSTNQYACENTYDKIFLLSYQDIINTNYGFSSSYSYNDTIRRKKTTNYAQVQGAYTDSNGEGWWWLRSPHSSDSDYAGIVNCAGNGGNYYVRNANLSVVPALQIRL